MFIIVCLNKLYLYSINMKYPYFSVLILFAFKSLFLNCVYVLSPLQLFVTPWTVARPVPLSMEFLGKDTGVGCHFLLKGIFPT